MQHVLSSAVLFVTALILPQDAGDEAFTLDSLAPPTEAVLAALLDQRTDDALTALDALMIDEPEGRDAWTFYRAETLRIADRLADARISLEGFEAAYPQSPWISKARFLRAELSRRIGDPGAALEIVREEARALRGAERRDELSAIYVAVATRFAAEAQRAPAESRRDDLRSRAASLFEGALELETTDAVRAATLVQRADLALASNDWAGVETWLKRTLDHLDAHPDTTPPHPAYTVDAQIGRGTAALKSGHPEDARRIFEDLVSDLESADGDAPWRASARGDALFGLGVAHTAADNLLPAIDAYEALIKAQNTHVLAHLAAAQVTSGYRRLGRTDDAILGADLERTMPAPLIPASDLRSGLSQALHSTLDDAYARDPEQSAKALGIHALFVKAEVQRQAGRIDDAIETYETYVREESGEADWAAAEAALVTAKYTRAVEMLEKTEGDQGKADVALKEFVSTYALDDRRDEARFLRARLPYVAAISWMESATEAERKAQRALAIQQLTALADRSEGSDLAGRSIIDAAQIAENALEDPAQAIELLRRVRQGTFANAAAVLEGQMREKSLRISTPKLLRTGEPLDIRLFTRNIEEVEVRTVALDLASYFARHHTVKGIESLDLDLIAPDAQRTMPVADYVSYAPLERTLTIPTEREASVQKEDDAPNDAPGVYAVSVIADGKRATTLVVRSDLDLITKVSRQEVFIFATDVSGGVPQPADGVEIVVSFTSGGERKQLTAATDDKGFASIKPPAGDSFGDGTQVFAARNGHVAAADLLGTMGTASASPLGPRAHMQTDRSAYRPGETLHARAVLRDATDGRFQLPTATAENGDPRPLRVRFDVASPGGYVVQSSGPLSLSGFGTAAASFELPEAADSGRWTISVVDELGATRSSATFDIAQFELPRTLLTVEAKKNVVLRGEEIELTATAATGWGVPLADARVDWSLPNGKQQTVRTGANGVATLRYPTRDGGSDESLAFEAVLPEDGGLRSKEKVWVTSTALKITVSVDREVTFSGESFNVSIETKGPDGEPVESKLALLMKRSVPTSGGRYRESIDERRDIVTNADGLVTVPLSAGGGGFIEILVDGMDAFGHRVEARATTFSSDESDAVKLRVRATETDRVVGMQGIIDVFDRTEGGLALVTFEGSTVLEHRLVNLEAGANQVAFDVSDAFVPDVMVSVAAIRDRTFHHGTATFLVARPLVLEVTMPEQSAPGEETTLEIRATDGNGKPVAAEVSLSLIDESLFGLFADRTPSLKKAFGSQGKRTPSFETASSATFAYEGHTAKIAQAILDEKERVAQEDQKQAMRGGVVRALSGARESRFQFESNLLPQSADMEFEGQSLSDSIAVGGGGGGKFGGRFGGGKNLRAGGRSRTGPPESTTAYWNAGVVTDAATGAVTIKIPMPAREASWRLAAYGIAKDHRFGQAKTVTSTSSPYVLEVHCPTLVSVGDEPRVRAEIMVESSFEAATPVTFELRATCSGKVNVLRAEALLEAGASRATVTFAPLEPVAAGAGRRGNESSSGIDLVVTAMVDDASGQVKTLSAKRGVGVRPSGFVVHRTESGSTQDLAAFDLTLEAEDRELVLVAGASSAQWLVNAMASTDQWLASRGCRIIDGPREQAATLFGVASILRAAGATGGLSAGQAAALGKRADQLIASLVSPDGIESGWGAHRTAAPDSETTARVLVALVEAGRAGRLVPAQVLEAGASQLEGALTNERDELPRAWGLWALSATGRPNDLALGRMHRERARLGRSAAGALACALAEADKKPMAVEAAAAARAAKAPAGGGLEARAMVLLGEAYAGTSAQEGLDALYAMRPWRGGIQRGLAAAACARSGALGAATVRDVTFTVAINGGAETEVTLDADNPIARLDLDPGSESTVRAQLKLVSGDRLDFAASLSGVTAVAPEPTTEALIDSLRIESPLPRIDSGFDVLINGHRSAWRNEVKELEFGASARIVCSLVDGRDRNAQNNAATYELEIPLPAGVMAWRSESSVFTERDGSLFVPFDMAGGQRTFTFEVIGTDPGQWVSPPPVLRSTSDPASVTYGAPFKLVVLGPGETTGDEYRVTPDERLARGRLAFNEDAFQEVRDALRPLFAEWRRDLKPAALSETARLLLFSSLADQKKGVNAATPSEIVDWFEILKEREPELFVSFDATLAIGDAYASIEEPARALSLFRAVIDETLGEDMRLAAALDAQGQWNRASAFIGQTWARYPNSPRAEDADLALASRLVERGLGNKAFPGATAEVRQTLAIGGIARLLRIVSTAQGDTASDAGLALISALVELEDWKGAAERAELFARAFNGPKTLDAFRYTEAVARWNMGEDEQAMQLLQAVADAKYASPGGGTQVSENRDLALYILAQIHHARREPLKAAEFYGRVDRIFADAAEALAELSSERLDIEEDVVRVRPGESAAIRFDHKGIDEVEALVYPVDLMTLALRERDLSRVTSVDLAGVTPTSTQTVKLARAVLSPAEGTIEVPLAEAGAYLVMLRGAGAHRSVLLIASDVSIDLAVDRSGGVRAHLVRKTDKSFPRGAEVRVLDVSTGRVTTGKTDPRGIFTAGTSSGNVTVIARAEGGHYAFEGVDRSANRLAPEKDGDKSETPAYFKNVFDSNRSQVQGRQKRFDSDIKRKRKGVQVQSLK